MPFTDDPPTDRQWLANAPAHGQRRGRPDHQEKMMKIAKQDLPATIDVPGAVARQVQDFGTANGYGVIAGEWFSLAAGTDIAPLLKGLPTDDCHAPHWGYVIEGEVTVRYTDGAEETVRGGDLFYWPPGHSVRVGQDAEVILFSPAQEHNEVLAHMSAQMAG